MIALLVLPYALVFVPFEDNAGWMYLFVWEDEILIRMFAPFLVLWLLYLVLKKNWQIVILLLLSFLYLVNSFGSLAMPMQDFAPSAGLFIAASLFPFTLFLYLLTRKKRISGAHK